jgi:hypothetical protein
MPKTVEVVVGEDGSIQLPDSITLKRDQRVLVTILGEGDEDEQEDSETGFSAGETALLSEETLAEDWIREEEEEAWKHLQPDQ